MKIRWKSTNIWQNSVTHKQKNFIGIIVLEVLNYSLYDIMDVKTKGIFINNNLPGFDGYPAELRAGPLLYPGYCWCGWPPPGWPAPGWPPPGWPLPGPPEQIDLISIVIISFLIIHKTMPYQFNPKSLRPYIKGRGCPFVSVFICSLRPR